MPPPASPDQPASAKPFWRETLRVLRQHPAFARYMGGTGVSLVGTWMQVAAQGYVVSTLTDKASVLGWINLANGLPMLLLTVAGGSVADRYDKRRVLLLTQFVQAALAVLMGVLIVSHRLAIWHVAAIAALLGVAAAFEVPADSALVPELVDKDSIRVAIGLDRSLFHATRFLGPAVAGVVIAKLGAASAFFINALSFAALVAAILTLAPRKLGSAEEEEQRAGGMKDGIAYLRGDKPTLSMIGLLASTTCFIAPVFIVVLPLYVKDVLHLGPDKLGYLMAVSGVGSMLGAISLLAIPPAKRLARLFWAVSSAALATLGFALAPNFWAAAGCMVFMSVGVSTVFGVANTIVQERTPDFLRGRVSALAGLSFFGLIPFAGVGFSSLADAIGMRHAILLGGISFGVAATSILLGPGRRACFPVHEAPERRSGTALVEPLA